MDAAIIADFVCALKPAAWQPPTLEVAQLQALVRRREELSLMLQAEKNRLEGIAPNVRSSLERIIATLSAEKARLEKLISQQIRSHQQLSRDHQLLCTIKGIGSLTAAILLAEMARPGQVERARQAAAHAGLAPRRAESGTSVRRNRGLGKEGNRYLRKALYMPALVAIKYNAPLCHFASRLRAAGKPKMSIVCAVMRSSSISPSVCSNIKSPSIPHSYDHTTALHFKIVSTAHECLSDNVWKIGTKLVKVAIAKWRHF